MELPTYTGIWKIEKRLYKVYDFRLPMPVPLGRITAFLAIAAPYILVLALAGLPVSHTLIWVYVLPPGALTWLVTRPVLEGKRLTELLLSQARYLAEPRTWCRLAPSAGPGQVLVTARAWRRPGPPAAGAGGGAGGLVTVADQPARPGTPDPAGSDRAGARLMPGGPARIAVVGTTAGSGQTVTALLAGQLLAELRGEPVAVIDFGGRAGGADGLAARLPLLTGCPPAGLDVLSAGPAGADAAEVIGGVAARYPVTLADPAAPDVPGAVRAADQLVLVSPAGGRSAELLAMTLDWLGAHGCARLAGSAVVVLNGIVPPAAPDAERAAAAAAGRCRAVVRVPWDPRLAAGGAGGALSPAAVQAFTALAGLLVPGPAGAGPALAGPAGRAAR